MIRKELSIIEFLGSAPRVGIFCPFCPFCLSITWAIYSWSEQGMIISRFQSCQCRRHHGSWHWSAEDGEGKPWLLGEYQALGRWILSPVVVKDCPCRGEYYLPNSQQFDATIFREATLRKWERTSENGSKIPPVLIRSLSWTTAGVRPGICLFRLR